MPRGMQDFLVEVNVAKKFPLVHAFIPFIKNKTEMK
jgi:hypothetical protein